MMTTKLTKWRPYFLYVVLHTLPFFSFLLIHVFVIGITIEDEIRIGTGCIRPVEYVEAEFWVLWLLLWFLYRLDGVRIGAYGILKRIIKRSGRTHMKDKISGSAGFSTARLWLDQCRVRLVCRSSTTYAFDCKMSLAQHTPKSEQSKINPHQYPSCGKVLLWGSLHEKLKYIYYKVR